MNLNASLVVDSFTCDTQATPIQNAHAAETDKPQIDLGQTDDDSAGCQECADDGSGQEVRHKAEAQKAQDQINHGHQ